MNQQTVKGVAYRDTTRLGIVNDGFTHLQVTFLIEIGVYHSCTSLNDRDAGGITDKVDKLSSTTGDAKVYIAHGIQHFTCGLMGCRQ